MIVFSIGYWFQRTMKPYIFNIVLTVISLASIIPLIMLVD